MGIEGGRELGLVVREGRGNRSGLKRKTRQRSRDGERRLACVCVKVLPFWIARCQLALRASVLETGLRSALRWRNRVEWGDGVGGVGYGGGGGGVVVLTCTPARIGRLRRANGRQDGRQVAQQLIWLGAMRIGTCIIEDYRWKQSHPVMLHGRWQLRSAPPRHSATRPPRGRIIS